MSQRFLSKLSLNLFRRLCSIKSQISNDTKKKRSIFFLQCLFSSVPVLFVFNFPCFFFLPSNHKTIEIYLYFAFFALKNFYSIKLVFNIKISSHNGHTCLKLLFNSIFSRLFLFSTHSITMNLATEYEISTNTRIFLLLEINHEIKWWQFCMF